jgi:glucose/arabinose dehydrogenase
MRRRSVLVGSGVAVLLAALAVPHVRAQGSRASPPMPPLPQTLFSAELPIRVVPVATGLSHPWSLAFLPGGDMLVTERAGRLRIVRNGQLAAEPVPGTPAVVARVLGGLLDVVLHPRFAENQLVYLSYSKGRDADALSTTAVARARFDGRALRERRRARSATSADKARCGDRRR